MVNAPSCPRKKTKYEQPNGLKQTENFSVHQLSGLCPDYDQEYTGSWFFDYYQPHRLDADVDEKHVDHAAQDEVYFIFICVCAFVFLFFFFFFFFIIIIIFVIIVCFNVFHLTRFFC